MPLSFIKGAVGGFHARIYPDRASFDVSILSVAIWVRWEVVANNKAAFVRGWTGSINGSWHLGTGATGKHAFILYLGGAKYEASSASAPVVGVWYHYAGTYDPADSVATLYVNGEPDATVAVSAAIDAAATNVQIADVTPSSSDHGEILAAHACLWSLKLTTDDIAALAGGTPPHIVRPDGRVLCDILEPDSLDVIANIHATDNGNVANVPASSPRFPGFLRPLPWDGRVEDDEEDAFEAMASSFNPLLFSRARSMGGRVR